MTTSPLLPHDLRDQNLPLFEAMDTLANSDAAKVLLDRDSSGPALAAAAKQYVALGSQSGLPPDRWLLEPDSSRWSQQLLSPLFYFQNLGVGNAARAQAAKILADAGCSLWNPDWIFVDLNKNRSYHRFNSELELSRFVFSGVDTPLRRLFLKLALADPSSSHDLAQHLLDDYCNGVEGSSKTAKGSFGSRDKTAKAICSVLCSCETDILIASKKPEWKGLADILEDAKERLEAKKEAAGAPDPATLRKSLSATQKVRMRSLATLISKCPEDDELILASIESSPWLDAQPALFSITFSKSSSLLALAMLSGSVSVIERMEAAGANLWLAAAQNDQSNACEWVFQQLDAFSSDADLSCLARMLLRGAWLDIDIEPKKRCLGLATEALANVRDQYDYDDDEAREEIAKAEGLLAALERVTLEEALLGDDQSSQRLAKPSPLKSSRRPGL